MSDADDRLHDFLAPGFGVEDLPMLFPLLRGRELLRAFTALFHGGEGNVLVRLLVLRTLGGRPQQTDWTPQEIREQLAYIDPVKLDTVVGRLKEHGLLVWDAEHQRYRVSPLGRKALAALSTLLQFEASDADGLGYITAQLAAGQAMGQVSAEELGHLLCRLGELKDDFDHAVLSGSEYRIRAAADALESAWRWVEKGTEIVRRIAAEPELDPPTHRLAQAVGRAQGALLRQAGVFQRALNQIDRDRVHLGRSGLSSSDLVGWLRGLGVDRLVAYADEAFALPLRPAFVQDQIALDVAEFELIERERHAELQAALPAATGAPDTDTLPIEREDYSSLTAWRDQLRALDGAAALSDLVPHGGYAQSAYRLSLLGLLGDPESGALDGPAADLARLSLRLEVDGTLLPIGRDGIAAISGGRLVAAGDEVPAAVDIPQPAAPRTARRRRAVAAAADQQQD